MKTPLIILFTSLLTVHALLSPESVTESTIIVSVQELENAHLEVERYYSYFIPSKTVGYNKLTPNYVPSLQFDYLTHEVCPYHLIGYGGILIVLLCSHSYFKLR